MLSGMQGKSAKRSQKSEWLLGHQPTQATDIMTVDSHKFFANKD